MERRLIASAAGRIHASGDAQVSGQVLAMLHANGGRDT